jgi:hypothetical protein
MSHSSFSFREIKLGEEQDQFQASRPPSESELTRQLNAEGKFPAYGNIN